MKTIPTKDVNWHGNDILTVHYKISVSMILVFIWKCKMNKYQNVNNCSYHLEVGLLIILISLLKFSKVIMNLFYKKHFIKYTIKEQ